MSTPLDRNPPDYTIVLITDASAQACFEAINDPQRWWDGRVEGSADHLGAEFTYTHGGLHMSVQRVVELVEGKRVVWEVVASELGFVDEVEPWTGTTIVFDLEADEQGTTVTMTHHGLTPALACYDQCSFGWDHVIGRSLQQVLATGELVRF